MAGAFIGGWVSIIYGVFGKMGYMNKGKSEFIIKPEEYRDWLDQIKKRVIQTRSRIAVSVNEELISLYWYIGATLSDRIEKAGWGSGIISRLARDLSQTYPDQKGFSRTNLFYMKKFYDFYSEILLSKKNQQDIGFIPEFVQQLAGQIPWGHNMLILDKANSCDEALFYAQKIVENGWSRSVLAHQIESGLFTREGRAINNFAKTLPPPQSDLARETLKDPYKLDFIGMKNALNERSIEDQLINHISRFLLELGTGFAFVGRQYCLQVGRKEYFIDLLFYHLKLRCYVVIELKAKEFKPEYAGKLNFYLSAVDDMIKQPEDSPTIGLLLCKNRDRIEAEYALRGMSQPMGVAEYELSRAVPEDIRSELPSIEDIEAELEGREVKGRNTHE